MSARYPDFYIIGAPKAGTSSLAQYLDEHPDVFISKPKEPRYFAADFRDREVSDEKAYLDLFAAAEPHMLLGEGTTDYLVSSVAVERILAVRPDARIVAMLRNPLDMFFAMHAQEMKNGYESLTDPEEAWAAIGQRKAGKALPALCNEPKRLFYDDRCRIGSQLERLQAQVPESQLKVIFYEDFSKDTATVYADTLRFLGIDRIEARSFPVYNSRHYIKHPGLIQAWKFGRLVKDKLGLKTEFGLLDGLQRLGLSDKKIGDGGRSASLLRTIAAHFEDDVQLLSRLTGRNLSGWLAVESRLAQK